MAARNGFGFSLQTDGYICKENYSLSTVLNGSDSSMVLVAFLIVLVAICHELEYVLVLNEYL